MTHSAKRRIAVLLCVALAGVFAILLAVADPLQVAFHRRQLLKACGNADRLVVEVYAESFPDADEVQVFDDCGAK